jgi:hypothetical protein
MMSTNHLGATNLIEERSAIAHPLRIARCVNMPEGPVAATLESIARFIHPERFDSHGDAEKRSD